MAKKTQAKKSIKKAAKKSPAKAAKKTAKKSAPKKATKKAAPKKAAKKAMKAVKKATSSAAKAVKKAAPKKAVKTAAKSAKKAVKKVVKKATSSASKAAKKVTKKVAAPAKKVATKAKAVAKKVVKKAAPKKAAPKKSSPKRAPQKSVMSKAKTAINNMTHSVSDFIKDAASTVIEKITPSTDDSSSSSENNTTSGHSDSSEKEGGSDEEEEEERKFVKHQTRLKAGDLAPFFEGKDQNGNDVTLASFPGKTIILYFYPKDDTPGCTATACSLRDEQRYLGESNYAVVGVSADDERSHAKFAAKYEIPFPLLADINHKIIKAYDVFGTKQMMGKIFDGIIRTTFVIAPNGIIRQVIKDVDTQNHAQQILNLEQDN